MVQTIAVALPSVRKVYDVSEHKTEHQPFPRTSDDQIRRLAAALLKYQNRKHLRIGQLIYNVTYPMDVFHIENDELIRRIEADT